MYDVSLCVDVSIGHEHEVDHNNGCGFVHVVVK